VTSGNVRFEDVRFSYDPERAILKGLSFEVPAGKHTFRARLADTATGEFRHHGEASVDLAPGRVLVIDFIASRGGFQFHG